MNPRLTLLISLLFVGCHAFGASDYEIRLNRNSPVGTRYRIAATGIEEQSLTLRPEGKEAVVKSDRLTVELVANCEVLAVSLNGREAQTKVVIEKLVRVDLGKGAEILPPGTIVVAKQVLGKTSYTTGEKPIADLAAKALGMAGMSMHGGQDSDDDAIYGTTGRKKVGDSWPVNAAAAAADLARLEVSVKAEKLTGTTTLVEETKVDGQPVLRISTAIAVGGVNLSLPPGLVLKKSEFKVSASGLYPVDTTQPTKQTSTTMSLEVTTTGTHEGKPIEATKTVKTVCEAKFSRP